MKTITIKNNINSVTITLRRENITTILNINNRFENKANSIIINCISIGYILITE